MAKDLTSALIQAGRLVPEEIQDTLQKTYSSLMTLKAQDETSTISPVQATAVPPAPLDWRKSISKHTIRCLECGMTFKQLSVRHLRQHDLDGRSYRAKYGIPRTQPLSAKAVTAIRKHIVQRSRPWEKAPTFLKAQKGKATAAKKGRRTARAKV